MDGFCCHFWLSSPTYFVHSISNGSFRQALNIFTQYIQCNKKEYIYANKLLPHNVDHTRDNRMLLLVAWCEHLFFGEIGPWYKVNRLYCLNTRWRNAVFTCNCLSMGIQYSGLMRSLSKKFINSHIVFLSYNSIGIARI